MLKCRAALLVALTALCLDVSVVSQDAFAAKKKTPKPVAACTNIIPPFKGFLYKESNFHGGRGPSLICGYAGGRNCPPCSSLAIRNIKGTVIGKFGCYDPGHAPYGRRFYTGVPGGSYTNSGGLLAGARKGGSNNILIQTNGTTCVRINNPTQRQGNWF
jgi:hypothetical protein